MRLVGLLKSDFDRNIFKSIISVSMPNGVENTLFQIGTVVISVLVSSLGTVTITANSVAGNVTPLILSLGLAFNTVIMVLVGQCMGAGEPDEAEMYIKHTLKLDYFLTFINGIIFMVVLLPMISVFHVSPEAKNLAAKVLAMYACFSVLFYPSGFALPSALRGSGDTKFVMAASIASMFIFRIGAAYFFVRVMNMGLIGTWLAMGLDWIIRTVIFTVRFLQRKWKENKII